jgi:hypothetical protein
VHEFGLVFGSSDEGWRIRFAAGVAVTQGVASLCATHARASVGTREDRVREDCRDSVMGAIWLADEDGDRFLRGVCCSRSRSGRVSRNVRTWAPTSPECGGVGVVLPRPTNTRVILVF